MIGALSALLIAAPLLAGSAFSVDSSASTVTYRVVHKLHRVDGTSHEIEGRAVVKDDGLVLAMVRVPVATFRSGDANRDEHMLETLEVGKQPFVVFKGTARLAPGGEFPPGLVEVQGEVDLHGVKRPLVVQVSLEAQQDGSHRVRGHFEVSLEAHGIQRPSLLFVKIEDACGIDLDLSLRKDER